MSDNIWHKSETGSSRTASTDDPSENEESSSAQDSPSRKKHRPLRWNMSPSTLCILERVFAFEPSPSVDVWQTLAAQLKVKPRQVQVWFQTRRKRKRTRRDKCFSTSEDIFNALLCMDKNGPEAPQNPLQSQAAGVPTSRPPMNLFPALTGTDAFTATAATATAAASGIPGLSPFGSLAGNGFGGCGGLCGLSNGELAAALGAGMPTLGGGLGGMGASSMGDHGHCGSPLLDPFSLLHSKPASLLNALQHSGPGTQTFGGFPLLPRSPLATSGLANPFLHPSAALGLLPVPAPCMDLRQQEARPGLQQGAVAGVAGAKAGAGPQHACWPVGRRAGAEVKAEKEDAEVKAEKEGAEVKAEKEGAEKEAAEVKAEKEASGTFGPKPQPVAPIFEERLRMQMGLSMISRGLLEGAAGADQLSQDLPDNGVGLDDLLEHAVEHVDLTSEGEKEGDCGTSN